jgi:hypothetical protein
MVNKILNISNKSNNNSKKHAKSINKQKENNKTFEEVLKEELNKSK